IWIQTAGRDGELCGSVEGLTGEIHNHFLDGSHTAGGRHEVFERRALHRNRRVLAQGTARNRERGHAVSDCYWIIAARLAAHSLPAGKNIEMDIAAYELGV